MRVRALPLARALVRRGHAVTMLLPPWDDPGRAGQSWDDAGVRVVNVALPPAIPLLFHILLTRTLVAQALALQPEVVHLFKPKAYAGLVHLVLWWLRRLGVLAARLVVDSDDWEQAWNERLPYSSLQKKLFAWQEQWGVQHAYSVTVASRTLEKLVTARRPDGQNSVFYLPNGFPSGSLPEEEEPGEDGAWVRERWQLGQSPTVLLYSRFAEFRLARIVTLVQQVATRLPQARWLIVGRGFQQEEERLQRDLTQAGFGTETVKFVGWQPLEALPGYFAAADLAVFPYDDTLINRTKCSVKLIDLLAAGLPVVADAVGQNGEYMEDGVSGRLLPAEDDPALAGAVVDLLEHPQKRRRMGQAAARRVREAFHWSQLAQIAERAYG